MSRTSPPPPPMYYTPDGAKSVNDVGGGKIWTVEDEDDDEEKLTGIHIMFELNKKMYFQIFRVYNNSIPSNIHSILYFLCIMIIRN